MSEQQTYNIIISGGGTGGHIFPAIAIADKLSELIPKSNILFIGAKGKMEMEKVPAAGYEIKGLEIAGFQRGHILKNISFPFKVFKSMYHAFIIIKKFKPHIAIGVGGYASGPMLMMCALLRIKIVIQEQNFYPGVTNKILSKFAKKIFVAYQNMDVFFPKHKLLYLGNPVRKSITTSISKESAHNELGFDINKKTVFIMGGSLGARTLNDSIINHLNELSSQDIQLIWQTGSLYYKDIKKQIGEIPAGIKVYEFIQNINLCYAAADIIVSRAGALSVSELCIIGKPIILVPSPNVSEDHQTKNAMALVEKNAAILIKDNESREKLYTNIIDLLNDDKKQSELSTNIKELALPEATTDIAKNIIKVLKNEY
jgi:UDP-N-acetylglucosamine--N-acetylmuramyl-(pentapeptide) pyrophosphoryl-undecaprenol N-acetylglucosamine transferase